MIYEKKIWLIGAGVMSQEYAKVMLSLKLPFLVIGRGNKSKRDFQKKTGKKVLSLGLKKFIKSKPPVPKKAIVAVNIDSLKNVVKDLINFGVKEILLEKPGGLNIREINYIYKTSTQKKIKIFIAYNRRFYNSVNQMKKIIKKDKGIKSIIFEFTEFSSQIKKIKNNINIKKNWFFANSSHVVDLVFYLAGRPKKWNFYVDGALDWHPDSARFCGSGITTKGIFFSYLSDWQAPGSWKVEVLTKNNRLILKPLEKLQIVKDVFFLETKKSRNINDIKFKPGLFLQIKNFVKGNYSSFCSISDQVKNMKIYSKMAGYK